MPENSHNTRRQFSLRLLLVMMAVVLSLVYVSSQVWNGPLKRLHSPPMRLAVVLTSGGLQRTTTVIENESDKLFDGGILVLKNNGLIFSNPITIAAKGAIGIESNRSVMTLLDSKREVILDLTAENAQTKLRNWIQTAKAYEFQENQNEWVYQHRSLVLNDILHTYKIIIAHNYKQALSKYSEMNPTLISAKR